ncbi:hypothetical protein ACFY9F_07980 [Streptomyces sp. NPDC012421]|uniref:hypothetical protein n=1 Tax=Streptomyces sp. NPDC012421 TaxID=3364832 RepID=UPI0036DFBBC4
MTTAFQRRMRRRRRRRTLRRWTPARVTRRAETRLALWGARATAWSAKTLLRHALRSRFRSATPRWARRGA